MIIDKLKQLHILGSIVVMPDFFVDRIIRLDAREKLASALEEKAKNGGGSVRGVPTTDIRGGNAVNVAYALAKMGAKVTLFTVADEMGAAMIRQSFSQFGDRVTLKIAQGRHGCTTAFEFPHDDSRVNVMVSDIGDNASFGPDKVSSKEDQAALKNADAVMVVNWASNQKGTELAEHVFKGSPSALHFIDPADIATRKQEFRDALFKLGSVTDYLSINENECDHLASALGLDAPLGASYRPDDVKKAAAKIAESIGITTDLHTRIGSAWSNGKEVEFVHAIKVEPKILTGAGDVWDAADILGYIAGLDSRERLLFANAASSLYVRQPSGEPPAMSSVFELIERVQ
ncbi:sugar kinase, ribokinase [Candidatus Nitrososphaera evergladensis SR1]|uniref:Sugar kinase, ribokinase n=1 Tax=Candidatus Nitrososphaera evergladensis SR1 TaxID=1459636 RepID=A0A075MVG1_9ARCH|nr:carbohydrate kinase family protein [Candidatus Nitrososphaera evergladensis]AIF85158.1 sugar kinase, ribokinase [Candidatus Nitrososphaera evergladensis SR1]